MVAGFAIGLIAGLAMHIRQATPIPPQGILFYSAFVGLTIAGGVLWDSIWGRLTILSGGFSEGILIACVILSPSGGMF